MERNDPVFEPRAMERNFFLFFFYSLVFNELSSVCVCVCVCEIPEERNHSQSSHHGP